MTPAGQQKMYSELAHWWPLISPPDDYAEEAAFYLATLQARASLPIHTLLELGSGGGNNAFHMKAGRRLTLVDASESMLAVSRELNPDCEHLVGDMRTLRLGRTFQAVFIHDAICYMRSEEDLRAALTTAFVHLAPGGAALFAPDWVRETFVETTDLGGADAPPRAARYLEWSHDPDPSDSEYTVDYCLLLRDEAGAVSVVHDRHVEGIFARDVWLRLMAEVGFDAGTARFQPSDHPVSLDVFVGTRSS